MSKEELVEQIKSQPDIDILARVTNAGQDPDDIINNVLDIFLEKPLNQKLVNVLVDRADSIGTFFLMVELAHLHRKCGGGLPKDHVCFVTVNTNEHPELKFNPN